MRQLSWTLMLLALVLGFSLNAAADYVDVTYTGTAFVVHPDGYLLTCAHMIDYGDAESVTVTLDGKNYPASVLGYDSQHDLALLQIQVQKLPALPLANSNAVRLGEEVRAVGYPLSNLTGGDIKMTRGSIAGITTIGSSKTFQIDAAVNEGNSGGPIVNESGEVVGIVNAKLTVEGVEGVGFAVPVNYARTLLRNEFIEPPAPQNGEKLDGPTLAQRVTPAVAFLTVKTMEWQQEEGEGEGEEGEGEEGGFVWESIRAKSIELVGAKGEALARFGVVDNEPVLSLFDAKGNARAEFRIVKGEPDVSLFDADNNYRAGISLFDGEPAIMVADGKGNTRGAFRVFEGEPDLALFDDRGKARLQFSTDEGEPGLLLFDKADKNRLILGLLAGEPVLALMDTNSKLRGGFTMIEGEPNLILGDANGKERVWLRMQDGDPGIAVLSKTGKVTWTVP
ncbi:MAG: S1C family serine protease [Armatimonadota bacterium]